MKAKNKLGGLNMHFWEFMDLDDTFKHEDLEIHFESLWTCMTPQDNCVFYSFEKFDNQQF
jgi:hypothetical protein